MKKIWFLVAILLILIVPAYFGYRYYSKKQSQKAYLIQGEKLAQQYCATCHLFPDPNLLTKDLWSKSVLPNMGARLGMKSHFDFFYPSFGNSGKPLLSQDDWNILVYFYLMNAPDSLEQTESTKAAFDTVFFAAESFMNFKGGIITALKAFNDKIYIAEATDSILSEVNLTTSSISKEKYDWPITDMQSVDNGLLLTSPGYLHPADHQMGTILTKDISGNDPKIIIDSLRRSLRTSISDFDQNGYDDLLICEFGHSYGQLSLYLNDGTTYKKKILTSTPGAICAQILDFNQDGLDDFIVLFAQGDERLVLYTNKGNQQFETEVVYRFPSIFGSLYFELADFNHDGLWDILYTNGDNGDYTPIAKPYHGVRILINQGNNQFKETWFYPMNGAAMAKSHDFDQDGKLDIIATANFTKSGKPAKEGLIFFHQEKDMIFSPYMFDDGDINQWNLLELTDADLDGDMDVLVGAMNLEAIRAQQTNATGKQQKKTSVLLLENQRITR